MAKLYSSRVSSEDSSLEDKVLEVLEAASQLRPSSVPQDLATHAELELETLVDFKSRQVPVQN
jgi:hypothetical protein